MAAAAREAWTVWGCVHVDVQASVSPHQPAHLGVRTRVDGHDNIHLAAEAACPSQDLAAVARSCKDKAVVVVPAVHLG